MKKPNIILLAAIIFTACKKPYNPPAIASPGNYLVVEGVINSGTDSTLIKLSRTVSLSSVSAVSPVLNAVVAVVSDQGTVFPLTETSNGNYVSAGLNLDNSHTYRLSIKTSNEQYQSDFVAVENSPPIDSISYTVQTGGVNIFANTHDPKNNTRYYRWDYTETWMFHSNYFSSWKSNGDTVVIRDQVSDQIYYCWKSDTSSTIVIGSSAKLAKDIIANNPITSIGATSEKLTREYSIQIKQYALTGAAYTFWENLKKNTEQLGGIFDAQPSNINGNIHSVTNPSEPVIGYVSVGSVASLRIFIGTDNLPISFTPNPFYPSCELDSELIAYYPPHATTPINQENEFFNINKGAQPPVLIPIQAIQTPSGTVIGHTGAGAPCVDCTLRGTNKQPSFWVNK